MITNPYPQLSITDLMATVMWLEARGDGKDGIRAVGHVIFNRVGAIGFPKTLQEVILQPNAFSSLLPNDPEYGLVPDSEDLLFQYAKTTASAIQAGVDTDLTFGAHYYANLEEVTSGWFVEHIVGDPVNHPRTAIIGKQSFYK